MRKLALFNLSFLLLFALAAAVEGSVQTEPVEPRSPNPLLQLSPDHEIVSAEDANVAICSELGHLGIPRLMMHAYVRGMKLDSQGSLTLCALAESAGLRPQALPEPATIAVWSLIGLCWSGVSCWRRRRGLSQSRIGAGSAPMRRCLRRPPWPDDVRARILEIIERGSPR
jgi:hypothetical protein